MQILFLTALFLVGCVVDAGSPLGEKPKPKPSGIVEIQLTSKQDQRIRKLVADLESVTVQSAKGTVEETVTVPQSRELSFGLIADRVVLTLEPGTYSQAALQLAPKVKSAESSAGMPLTVELRERSLIHDEPFEVREGETTQLVLEVDLGESLEFVAEDQAIFTPRVRVPQLLRLSGTVEDSQVVQICFFPWFPPLPPLPTGTPPIAGIPLPSPPAPPQVAKDNTSDCPRALATAKVALGKYSLRILPVPISARGFRGDGSFVDFTETLVPQPPASPDLPPADATLDFSAQ